MSLLRKKGGGDRECQIPNVSLDIGEFTYIDTFICVLSICLGRPVYVYAMFDCGRLLW